MVQFVEAISYVAGRLEIECFEQTLIASCAGNYGSDLFVRNFFHMAEFSLVDQTYIYMFPFLAILDTAENSALVFRLSPAWPQI